MFSLLHIQIIIDLFIFLTILFLLRRIDKNTPKIDSTVQEALLADFRKLLEDTHDSTTHFLETVEDSKKDLSTLFAQLDNKEKKLSALFKEAEEMIKKLDSVKPVAVPSPPEGGKYGEVIRMLQQGLSRDEISRQSGIPEGEINLILDLEKTKSGPVL